MRRRQTFVHKAIPDAGGVIHGCYKKTSPNQGTLRVIDTEKAQTPVAPGPPNTTTPATLS
jgi:hypothetical protein